MAFFERLGVPLKVERGNRVFPVSDRAFDISAALERRLKALHVRWAHDRALDIETADGAVCAVRGEGESYPADAVILATGGVSYPATGSTGDGHRLAAALGHTVTELDGSLVPLEGVIAPGVPCARLQGLSLRNVGLTVYEGKKKIYQDFGELLFTHFGVSGPLVLSASAHMRHFGKKDYRFEIDLKPALDQNQLDKRLLADFQKYLNHDFRNALDDLLPQKLIPVVIELSGIPPQEKVHDITREQRQALLAVLKAFPVAITKKRPVTDAIVTTGGVKVGEVDPKTMESKLFHGLYLAGELLDADAYTGGFNLQIAWATGRSRRSTARREGNAMKHINVAIDGPSGAGKSTIARAAAKDLGLLYVDTGAIYRSIGYYLLRHGVDPKDKDRVVPLLPGIRIALRYEDDGLQHMLLNGQDVTAEIRFPEVSAYASDVSAHAEVRSYLLEMQQDLARRHSVIMDGRDIGTVVLPEAELKIFLTAAPEERARRRCRELELRGTPEPYEKVLADIQQRDYNDTHRAAAPLRQAEDAVLLDSTHLDFDGTLQAVEALIRERSQDVL